MLLVKDIIKFLEEKFPPGLAYDWDNVGLQIGDVDRQVKRIMVALDATTVIIDEAIEKGIDLIITHHPFIFSSFKSIDLTTPFGKNLQKLIKHDITIYAMHTNYDIAPGGMNDTLAEKMGLANVKPFAMIDDAHGLGRIGELKSACDVDNLIKNLKRELHLTSVNFVQTNNSLIKRIAIIGGSGGKYIHEAKEIGADVLVTGDVTYHTAMDAKEIGLKMIDIAHYAEVIMEEKIAVLLNEKFYGDVKIYQTSMSNNPIEVNAI